MAEINWTPAQESAIYSKDNNILVSAAAGSGKTAVLVERVIQKITDKESPASLSSLLIMTFTRAAAAQMKEKIYKAIRKAIADDPENDHLKKQLHEVASARIYTIDALCMEIVRDHFQDVDIDPGFRIAEESETAIIRGDVLKEVIEEHYAEGSPEFLQFVDFYMDKSDAKIEELILSLYRFAQSHPEPERWIHGCIAPYIAAAHMAGVSETGNEELLRAASLWHREFANVVRMELETILSRAERGLDICRMNYGPYKYEDIFIEILQLVDSISAEDATFDFKGESIREFLTTWKRLPNITQKDEVDPDLKILAKDIRDDIRSRLKKLAEKFFSSDLEDAYMDMAACADVAGVIADLTIEFSERFYEAKKDRNIADFGDVSHMALKVLLQYDENGNIFYDDEGRPLYTDAADRIASEISEIIVDEYQDTNLIQEFIIGALSAERFDRPDVFMVGDVKQSIYGFRMACPELFNEKYNRYSTDDGSGMRILLSHNFRSRKEVLAVTNSVFEQAMIPEIGGIDYLDGHGLELGAKYPDPVSADDYIPELIFINGSGTDGKRSEAYVIAEKINELVSHGMIADEEHEGQLRSVRYSDIAILTRTSDNTEIEQMLDDMKIPVIKASNKGFFDSFEIRLIMNLLRVIDNPYPDIPFTAVLTSPVGGLSAQDLALIRIAYGYDRRFSMYEACRFYISDQNTRRDERIAAMVSSFMDMISFLRERSGYTEIGDLIRLTLKVSHLDNILTAMPQGDGRRANIEFLISKAVSGSRGSYGGLFNFIRYIDQMKDSDIDFGQSQVFEGEIDAVRMMTIHKSKGLEFPVVFLARAGKGFNDQDLRDSIIMDRNLGLGLEFRDPLERTVNSTILMETIRTLKKYDLYAEEMRLLYVAMTRAKEKLIISGVLNGLDKALATWNSRLTGRNADDDPALDPGDILECGSFMKLLGTALIGRYGLDGGADTGLFRADVMDTLDIESERAEEIFEREEFLADSENYIDHAEHPADDVFEELSWVYPFMEASGKVIKITASQLEDHSWDRGDDDRPVSRKPFRYIDDETGLRGAERGNAYHRFFEIFPYDRLILQTEDNLVFIRTQLAELTDSGMISSEYAETVEPEAINAFLNSGIGKRMKNASDRGLLHREQQFVMGFEEDGEQRLVQGIIDAFFEEDGELVLVDYKTDRRPLEQSFIDTYKGQLDKYAEALEAAIGKHVKEKIIYSIEMGREIWLP